MTTIDVTGKVHELKAWPEYFDAIVDGTKPFDVRVNDRKYEVGDVLRFKRWDGREPGARYTGEEVTAVITYVYHGDNADAPLLLRGFASRDLEGRPQFETDEIVVLGLALGIEIGN